LGRDSDTCIRARRNSQLISAADARAETLPLEGKHWHHVLATDSWNLGQIYRWHSSGNSDGSHKNNRAVIGQDHLQILGPFEPFSLHLLYLHPMPSSSLPHPAAPRAIMLADENETFSTPPTTPAAWTTLNGHGHGPNDPHQPSLSRRNSRPTSLHIDHAQAKYNSNIELSTSPLAPDHNQAPSLDAQVTLKPTPMAQDSSLTLKKTPTAAQALQSPCFVHSQLDQGAALTQWLLNKPETVAGDLGVAKSLQTPRLQHATLSHDSVTSSLTSTTFIDDGDEQYTSSLTTKLAETAVGVREMSKQLGELLQGLQVQSVLTGPPFRPCSSSVEYPEYPDCHQGTRQQAHQTHEGTGLVFDDEASSRTAARPRCVRSPVAPLPHQARWTDLQPSLIVMSMRNFAIRVVSMLKESEKNTPNFSSRFPGEDPAPTQCQILTSTPVKRKASFVIGPAACVPETHICLISS